MAFRFMPTIHLSIRPMTWVSQTGSLRYGAAIALIMACVCAAQAPDMQKLFQEAMQAQQRGEDAVAVSKYRELLRLHPEAVQVRLNLGAALAHQQRFREAIEQYRMVLASDAKNQAARRNLAMAYAQSGDFQSAIHELEQLHREDPAEEQTAMLLGDSYAHAGRETEAIALLAPLERIHPDDADLQWLLGSTLVHAGRAAEGVERMEKAAAAASNAQAYMQAAETRLNMSQFDLARRDAETAQHLNPQLQGLQTLRGMILEQSGSYDDAEALLLQAVASDPNDFNAHFYLGSIYYFKRQMGQARLHLTRALELQPTSVQARYEMALISRAEGQTDTALKDLEAVVRQMPDWLEPHVELSSLYYRLHRSEDGAREKQIVDRMMAAQQQSQAQSAR